MSEALWRSTSSPTAWPSASFTTLEVIEVGDRQRERLPDRERDFDLGCEPLA